ncbi:MAG: cyanophycinase [Phycisphaerales bacterium]
MRTLLILVLTATALLLTACSSPPRNSVTNGSLLVIGGGLDDDNKPVYERFIELSRRAAPGGKPHIIIATAASGDEPGNAQGKTESIRAYCGDARISTIGRDTPAAEAVAIIDSASAMFFTGGDQKRITAKYRPDGADTTPEREAMLRLLRRGGVIAGTSAGDAMMGEVMFFTGRSAEALGIRSTRTQRAADDDADEKREQTPLGPQIGRGMGMLSLAMTDSHFFERHRFGRLVAALEQSGTRLGIGVGEDAAVEVDLATGELRGVSVADSLLVDVGACVREGVARRGVRAKVIGQSVRVSLPARLASAPDRSMKVRPAELDEIAEVEPGQNRQLASWRFFCRAEREAGRTFVLRLDGYQQFGWKHGDESVVDIEPLAAPKP